MRFLASSECKELGAQVEFDVSGISYAATFAYKSRMKEADTVVEHLVDHFGHFSWALLWAYDFAWGDRSQEDNPLADWRQYAEWRRRQGEDRPLYDAPGHRFEADERATLIEAVKFAIYTGWDGVLVGRPLTCLISLSHHDIIKVQSRHSLSALAQQLNREGISQLDLCAP